MPYRELYRPTPEQSAPDSAEISLAIEHQRRFGHLDAAELWPASIDRPFAAEPMHSFAVSADGKRALVCSYKTAWLVDTLQMRSVAKTALPSYCRVAALSHDGSIAAFVCDDATLYRWGPGIPSLQRVWQSAGLEGTDVLELSADGAIAVTSHYSQRATVRVFDFASRTLVHSFRADSDECLALHPNGRHIVCFGDDSVATIHGPGGNSGQIHNTTGGAFSPNGKTLCVNDYQQGYGCSFYSVVAGDTSLQLGTPHERVTKKKLSRWNFQARFAPDGRRVLLTTNDSKICQLDGTSQAHKIYDLPMERKTSITAGNHSFLTGPLSYRSLGIHANGIAVVQLESEQLLGMICAASGEHETLVGITSSGFYGSVESEEALGDEFAWPYERPALASQLLSLQQSLVSEDEALHFKELSERRNAWYVYKDKLVVDLGDRELLDLNQGIIELTPELVHRALSAAAKEPCFGKPQLTQHTLQAVSEELRALSLNGKRAAFGDMLVRLRESLQVPAGEKKADRLEGDRLDGPSRKRPATKDDDHQTHRTLDELLGAEGATAVDSDEDEGLDPPATLAANIGLKTIAAEEVVALTTTKPQSIQRQGAGWPAKLGVGVILTGLGYLIATVSGLL